MFKKLWKILLVIFIVICIFFPFLIPALITALGTAWPATTAFLTSLAAAGIPWYVYGLVGVGIAYAIDPETTSEIIQDTANLAGTIVGAAAGVVSTGASALLSGFGGWLLAGLGVFLLLREGKQGDATNSQQRNAATPAPRALSQESENR